MIMHDDVDYYGTLCEPKYITMNHDNIKAISNPNYSGIRKDPFGC
jgi:hypothetical protein